MELDALDGVLLVAHAHDDALGAVLSGDPGGHLEALGQAGVGAGEGVVPGDGQALRQAGVDALGVVGQGRGLAVQDLAGGGDLAAVDVEDALLAHADAEHGDPAGEVPDCVPADAGVRDGVARPGTHDQLRRSQRDQLLQRDLVVAVDRHLGPLEHEVLVDVPGEGVIVVDEHQVRSRGDRGRRIGVVGGVVYDGIF